jgi:hypothetical protein
VVNTPWFFWNEEGNVIRGIGFCSTVAWRTERANVTAFSPSCNENMKHDKKKVIKKDNEKKIEEEKRSIVPHESMGFHSLLVPGRQRY